MEGLNINKSLVIIQQLAGPHNKQAYILNGDMPRVFVEHNISLFDITIV